MSGAPSPIERDAIPASKPPDEPATSPAISAAGPTSQQLDAAAHFTLIYRFCAAAARLAYRLFYRVEAFNPQHVPARGPVIIASNHQSHLDPPLIGSFIRVRPLSFVAKKALFRHGPFGWLISSLNAFPIDDEAGDIAAIRETLRRLAGGHAVLIFPEGTRSPDGAMHEYKRGISLLVKRAKCPVVPVAVEGCFDAFPTGGKLKLFGRRIAVSYGRPIAFDDLMRDGQDAALTRLARETEALRRDLRTRLRKKTGGAFPPPGPGDRSMFDAAPA